MLWPSSSFLHSRGAALSVRQSAARHFARSEVIRGGAQLNMQRGCLPFTLSVLGEFLGETHRGLPKLVRKRVNHAHHLGSPDARMRTLATPASCRWAK